MIYKEFDDKARNIPFGEKGSKDRAKYREKQQEVNLEFRAALEEDYGTNGHPKADKLWEMAWEDGHSEGYCGVENCYDKYSDLIL